MANQQTRYKIKSKKDFIRDCLTTNSLKQYWQGVDEHEIVYNKEYAISILDDLDSVFIEVVHQDDVSMINKRIILLYGLKDNNGNNGNGSENTTIAKDVSDITINSISSFGIAVASKGGNPKCLYEQYKLKELFKCLAKNGIEVSFNIKK